MNLAKYILLTIPTPQSDYSSIINFARGIIILEYIGNFLAGIGMSILTTYFVQGAIGGHNQLFQVSGKKFDPQILIKLIRLIISIYTLVNYVLWIVYGLYDLEAYILYRRLIYYGYTVVTGIISPLMFNGLLSKVISTLTKYYISNDEPIPVSLKYLIIFKKTLTGSFSVAITLIFFLRAFGNDYLQNYILEVQIVSNALTFYNATVLSIYCIYKTFPNVLKGYSGKSNNKSNRNSAVTAKASQPSKVNFAKTEKANVAGDNPIKRDLLFISSILSFFTQSIHLTKYIILTIPTDTADSATLLFRARAMMILDFVGNLFGGLAMNVLTAFFVKGAIGTNSELFQVSGKRFDPQIIIKLFRLFVLLYTTTAYILWATVGTETMENYILIRRLIYYSYAIITGVISPAIYAVFLGAIVNKLTNHYVQLEQPIPTALHYLILLKKTLTRSFSVALTLAMLLKVIGNDYLQNQLIYVQITTNISTIYTGTVLSTYGIYKAFPSLINSYTSNKSNLAKSNKNSVVASDDAKSKIVFAKTEKLAANTVMLPKQIAHSNELLSAEKRTLSNVK
ncbi:hypothetical protein HK103_006655 [Boothiomyces macroporosus]|uniref:Uncharacterized protein n=1 Tax=Boothiomyces macroporosus TaxID=261099 RepID=A0AAD5Y1Y8_9FUNG|nr:hypothetical protein HK103_006655 [Boothiomyces macroporosus]